MRTEDFIDQTAALRALGGQRVWSLMISLFGDLAQDDGQAINGPVLSAVMTLLQVRPEATRVALHRLRNDGWVVSLKSGRISQHSLTAKGRAETVAASPRIYAAPDTAPAEWHCVMVPENTADMVAQMAGRGFVQLLPRVFVGPAGATPPADSLLMSGTDVPNWVSEQLEPADLLEPYGALLTTLDTLQKTLPPATDLSPIESAVLRCLIVHNWRRLVLKHPVLPAPLTSPDWVGHRCHRRVAAMLDHYPRPALAEIEQHQAAA